MCKEECVLSQVRPTSIISTIMYQGGATASMHSHGHLRPHSTHRSQATFGLRIIDIPTGVVPKLLWLRPCYSHRRKDYGHLINTANHNPTVNLGVGGKWPPSYSFTFTSVSSFRRFSSLAHLIGPLPWEDWGVGILIQKTLQNFSAWYCSFFIHVWKAEAQKLEWLKVSDLGKLHSVDHAWSSEG